MHPLKIREKPIALREWAILSFLLAALTLALASLNGLGRLDQTLYDHLLQANTRAARDDIIIVAIDDYSLAELGNWPWPRLRHAELIEIISAARPLAIGMDILFAESEVVNPLGWQNGDQKLAAALTASNKVVLPLVSHSAGQGLAPAPPLSLFADAARALGHIHLEMDKDGVARSVFLQEGMHGVWWPHFALAMRELGRATDATKKQPDHQPDHQLPGARLPADQRAAPSAPGTWQRDYQMHIPFYGGSGHFRSVPYVAVLRGEVPAEFFWNKYVLVGPTALGMADSFTTPVSNNAGAMSGIEINANVLASLLDGRAIRFVPLWQSMLASLVPLLLAMLAYLLLSPRAALIVTALLFGAVLLASYLAMRFDFWWPPAAALIALGLAYPLWSWRRLEAAITYLSEEFVLLDREPHLLPEVANAQPAQIPPLVRDKLEKRIDAVRAAARRVRDLGQFVSDSLASLPDATLVTTVDGNVLLCNQAARDYFLSIGHPQIQDALLPYLFAKMSLPQGLQFPLGQSFSWWNLLDIGHRASMSKGIEVCDHKNRDLLIKSAPCYSGSQELSGWIVSVIDISAIRAAERSRDETLHFISHDMRAPQASILALLELQQDAQSALPQAEFLERIQKASLITLGLADNFVQLARAEAQTYRLEDMDFQDVLLDASEEMWSLARSKNIRISTHIPPRDYPVRIDRSLMTRALTNLLSNAIKYSPRDTVISCSLLYTSGMTDAHIMCTISDQGYGIARADQSRIFQRFARFNGKEPVKNEGVGLGMVFVKAVVERHHGQIDFVSAPGQGTTFVIKLPAFSI